MSNTKSMKNRFTVYPRFPTSLIIIVGWYSP